MLKEHHIANITIKIIQEPAPDVSQYQTQSHFLFFS